MAKISALSLSTLWPLNGGVQPYGWGRRGGSTPAPFIPDLLGTPAVAGQAYAELWLGVHPKLPSGVAGAATLDVCLRQQPKALGKKLAGKEFPILLKVLDIAMPLSIQLHPNAEQARILHRRQPADYPDANPKPEIALALSRATMLCGFRQERAIRLDVQRLKALGKFFGGIAVSPGWHQPAYARLMQAAPETISKLATTLAKEIAGLERPTPRDRRFLKLIQAYPGDRGAFCAYFMNEMTLKPGQGVFIDANILHSYQEGVLLECMVNSDNVVRGGLTEKKLDIATLLEIVDFRPGKPAILEGDFGGSGFRRYDPGAYLQVDVWHGKKGQLCRLCNNDLPTLLLVLGGQFQASLPDGKTFLLERGSAWFWPAPLASLQLQALKPGSTLARAMPE